MCYCCDGDANESCDRQYDSGGVLGQVERHGRQGGENCSDGGFGGCANGGIGGGL